MNKQMRLLLDDDWAPLQDWWNPSLEAERQRSHPGPDPFKSGRPSPFRQLPSADASCIWLIAPTAFTSRDLELIGVPPLLSWDVGRAFLAVVLSMLSWKEPTGSFKLSVRNSAS